jgi:beta-lactam-binding protein with PASTA domain
MKQESFGRILLKNLLLALGIVLVLVFVVLKCLDVYTQHRQQVVVPNVKGLSLPLARTVFAKSGLECMVVDSTFVKKEPAGTILETIPPMGNYVKAGRTIYLTINSHAARFLVVPEVKDISQRQAMVMLKTMGFERVHVQSVPGIYENLVLGLKDGKGKIVVEGSRISGDTPLYLLVSSGNVAIP